MIEIERKEKLLLIDKYNYRYGHFDLLVKSFFFQHKVNYLVDLSEIIEAIELFEADETIVKWVDGKIERREGGGRCLSLCYLVY